MTIETAGYRDPVSRLPLTLDVSDAAQPTLTDGTHQYPVVRSIPRFVSSDNYTKNFGDQWQSFAKTQLDSASTWAGWSETRFFEETRWPRDMKGQRILEAGSGMGRFTEVIAKTGATVCTFDYSAAVDANFDNNHRFANVDFAQADIYAPPYEPGSFDKVCCLGVIQHTPDPFGAVASLVRFLKPGGEIVFDNYRLEFKSFLWGKYYLRPLTSRLPPDLARAFVNIHMAWAYPFTGLIHKTLGLKPGYYASWLLSVADFRGVKDIDEKLARELSHLDTNDMLTPRYDKPQTVRTIRSWLEKLGLENIEAKPGYNGVEGRGKRPR